MRIIPVLDIKDGEVVRARKGDRDSYRPIATPLSPSPRPAAVAEGLRSLYPFDAFYIADLDTIAGGVPNAQALAALKGLAPAPELWVDAGYADEASLGAALGDPVLRPVVGSESQADEGLLRRFHHYPGLILSLDFFADGFRGPPAILRQPSIWPSTVLVMTLARVGAGAGPDLDRLAEIKAMAGDRKVFAAGGVRDAHDLRALTSLGIAGALVATSLHDGTLSPSQLSTFL